MMPSTLEQWIEIRKVRDPNFKKLIETNPELSAAFEDC